ncbi:MAG: transglutaminase domain-containing protein [Planctomycetota bacterium]|jgi:poly(3-hydroxybutyrate) depolymerase
MVRTVVGSPFVLALLAAAVAAQKQPSTIVAAFARAGSNRAELAQAWQQVPDAQRASLAFLLEHLPDGDATTLTAAFLLREVAQAHAARAAVPWGKDLAEPLFLQFVLPYAQANETREDWRSDFVRRFLPLVLDCKTPGDAAKKLNETIFNTLNVHYSTGRARADQAPSASIAQGKASCTGLSILLADACRACCVPARLVSVKWPHKDGNHTWVEVWDGAAWRFVGADEPDPAGLDRGWFTGDAAKCAAAPRANRLWAVSFACTGERFAAGWGRGIELWGEDVSARYSAPASASAVDEVSGAGLQALAAAAGLDEPPVQDPAAQDPAAAALRAQFDRFFAADAARRATFEFDRNLDAELATAPGDARLRALAAAAWAAHERSKLQADFDAKIVRAGDKQSPYTVKQVGDKPANGRWPLVIAMHGGGNAPKRVNDSQWQHMQIYYKDHPEAGGYLYCALRAPTDEWNGFYTDYFYPLLETLVRQFVVCGDVDPDRVVALGYSHGGYGAFAIGPKLPHRFAAVHGSAAAPTDGETVATGLHTLPFSFMVGGKDTAYGRAERCQKFAAELEALQKQHPGRYPFTFTFVEKNGHTGLPDRDLLAKLVPLVRTIQPRTLHWELTDVTVRDHYWLHVAAAAKGKRLDAELTGQQLVVTTKDCADGEAWLDARIVDCTKPLALVLDGKSSTVPLAPSLRVLCTTMAERGDPQLAASVLVPLR